MWKVKNNTGGILIIDDLEIDLKPRQEFDVDLLGRAKAEQSSDLSILIDKGLVEILHKDAVEESVSVSNDELSVMIANAMVNFMGGAFNDVSSELSQKVANSVANSIKEGLANVNIFTQATQVLEEELGEQFDEVNLNQVETDLFYANDELSAGFKTIGEKQTVEDSGDIAAQLKAVKKGKKSDKK